MQNYLKLIKHPNALELAPTTECIEEAKAGEITFYDALEYAICNGWSFVPPHDIGALTDGEIISEDGYIDDEGQWKPHTPDAVVYWFSNYMVQDPIRLWAEGRSVFFDRKGGPQTPEAK